MQMTPEVCCRKNAIFSGVAASAAMMRSPSFSRSSSSTTITISPRPMATTASSMRANGMCSTFLGQQAFYVLRKHVDFDVHARPGLLGAERGDRRGVRDDGHGEAVGQGVDHGQAAA